MLIFKPILEVDMDNFAYLLRPAEHVFFFLELISASGWKFYRLKIMLIMLNHLLSHTSPVFDQKELDYVVALG